MTIEIPSNIGILINVNLATLFFHLNIGGPAALSARQGPLQRLLRLLLDRAGREPAGRANEGPRAGRLFNSMKVILVIFQVLSWILFG